MDGEGVQFSMSGEPRGKGRPRVFVQGGRSIATTDPLTREYEASVTALARKAMGGRPPFQGALSVSIRFRMPIPKSATKREREGMAFNEIAPTTRPDLDNMLKAILDGMGEDAALKKQLGKEHKGRARVVFQNDTQIVRMFSEKVYSREPGVDVKVMCLEPQG